MSKRVAFALLLAGCGPSGPGAMSLDRLAAAAEVHQHALVRTCGWLSQDGEAVTLTTTPLWDDRTPGVDVRLKNPPQHFAWASWRCVAGEVVPVCENGGACFTSGLKYDWVLVEQ